MSRDNYFHVVSHTSLDSHFDSGSKISILKIISLDEISTEVKKISCQK